MKRSVSNLRHWVGAVWSYVRAVSGDDAYERYREHHGAHHPGEPVLSRREHFAERQKQKWAGVSRCC